MATVPTLMLSEVGTALRDTQHCAELRARWLCWLWMLLVACSLARRWAVRENGPSEHTLARSFLCLCEPQVTL